MVSGVLTRSAAYRRGVMVVAGTLAVLVSACGQAPVGGSPVAAVVPSSPAPTTTSPVSSVAPPPSSTPSSTSSKPPATQAKPVPGGRVVVLDPGHNGGNG